MTLKKTGRPYDVEVKAPITSAEIVEDHIQVGLDLPPILSPEGMGNLVRQDLSGRGFEEQEDGSLRRERHGVEVTVDPEGGTIDIKAEGEVKRSPPPPSKPNPCTCRIQEAVKQAQRTLEGDRAKAQQEVTERIEAIIGRLGCEMEGMVDRVTREALKEKARSLGEIKELSEDEKAGTLTIVVEV